MGLAALNGINFIARCTFRFPSTNIRLDFQSLVDEADPPVTVRQPSPTRSRDPLPPLRINIPDPDVSFSSPFPSPTGTIRYEKQMCALQECTIQLCNFSCILLLRNFYVSQIHCGQLCSVRFEVLMASSMRMDVFWVVVPCCLVDVYHHLRGACCLHSLDDGGSKYL